MESEDLIKNAKMYEHEARMFGFKLIGDCIGALLEDRKEQALNYLALDAQAIELIDKLKYSEDILREVSFLVNRISEQISDSQLLSRLQKILKEYNEAK